VNLHSKEGKNVLKKLGFEKCPLYFIMTPERNFTYGNSYGEYFTYNSLEMFLRMLSPEVNDVFKLSLLLLNCCCCFEFFIRQGGPIRRMMKLIWALGIYNCALLMLWLPILGLLRLPTSEHIIFYFLKFVRLFSGSSIAGMVRQDVLLGTYNSDVLLATFLILGIVVGIREYKRTGGVEEDMTSPDWWSVTWDGYTSYLFQPMATLSRPMTPQDLDLEEGMELLIERLAVPNLWLQPMIQIDYIKNLPVWPYCGPVTDSPVSSDGEGYDSGTDTTDCSLASGTSADNHLSKSSAVETIDTSPIVAPGISPIGGSGLSHNSSELSYHACARLVMDANYQCRCGVENSNRSGHTLKSEHGERLDLEASKEGNENMINNKNMNKKDVCKQDIENEPRSTFPIGMIFSSECVICLDSYKYGVLICGLPCGHSFHQQCILEWLTRDKHCCPVCRWPTYKSKRIQDHHHDD
jgi:E3 ubiquitin-protein ligase RNF103